MSYEFHPEALEEYEEATLYYAERVIRGLGYGSLRPSKRPSSGFWKRQPGGE